ncbi:photosynthetic reaction center subunit H [Methylobacterium durans]|uniref:photosynthetic reaction center subunit H n=1 Tax=Methylobacterium durans TaxID=2202825 RepID=UPI002AFEC08D|nr:photosynthetic reaction center subunit H [Methylobacterium durans]MEA1830685.1 photosynthetic reaction center subunit H [Methylobacterium durans]
MPRGEITGYVDVAQVVLYAFWIFFAGLVFWIRREDRREGYPLEAEVTGTLKSPDPILIPTPKLFHLSDGKVKTAPQTDTKPDRNFVGHKREPWPGAPLEPGGNPMQDHIGPGSWVHRDDEHDHTFDGQKRIIPLRVATHFTVHEDGPNPIGMTVFGADRQVAGTVTDLWIDRGECMVRYYEVELGAGGRRVLMPHTFCRTGRFSRTVKSEALLASQFADIPGTKDPDSVTLLEEEKIMAYFGAGTLYATPNRQEALL